MIEILKKEISDYELDGILIIDQYEILDILEIEKSYNFFEISPLLIITKKHNYIFVDKFTYEELKDLKDYEIVVTDEVSKGSRVLTKELKEILNNENIKRIGMFEELSIDGVKVIKIQNPFIKSFTILNERKKNILNELIDIAKKIYLDSKNKINPDEREIDIRNFIDAIIYEYGAEKRAYPTRVISGKRTSNPNTVTEGNRIDFPVILDFGILKKNLGIGISRTIFQSNNNSFLEKALELEKKLIEFIKPGRICSKIYEFYINEAERMGLKDFIYGPISKPLLPYAKGIYISKNNDDVIQPGSFLHVCVELYKPSESGIKIVDVIEVKDKAYNLTDFY